MRRHLINLSNSSLWTLFTFMNTQNKHGKSLTYMHTLINRTQCNVLHGQGLNPEPFTLKTSTLHSELMKQSYTNIFRLS